MKKTKNLIYILFGFLWVFTSCNKNDTKKLYIPLPVIETYEPVMKEIFISEIQELAPYKEQVFVVNSISELPDNLIFGNDEFMNQEIDFSKYSMIIFYDLQFGKILSTKYRWGYATDLEFYQVGISYEIEKGSQFVDGNVERVTYIRGAMLVDHIPQQSFISQNIGIYFIDTK